jgi:deazaflavin-dependent oxidoreductase (nitroreductase family)
VGQPLLLLTTVGARSGRAHTVPLLWFPDGPDRWLIVASYGGMAAHPAWYVNLVKHPDQAWIEVNGRKQQVQPESLRGPEREAAWRRITSTAPNYETYQSKTDREIPVVRLQKAALPG